MQVLLQQLGDASTSPSPSARLTCFPPDRVALQEAAASFDSPFLINLSRNWRAQVDCCSWEGVTCAAISGTTAHNQSRVVGLALADTSGLQDAFPRFPPALCRLSALSSLDFSRSTPDRIGPSAGNGPIPSCIGHNLTNLQHLNLSNQQFESTIPHSFSLRLALKTLDLGNNIYLFGSISPLANLPLLTFLNLSVNSFNGTMPIFNTPSLQYLNLQDNYFIGTMPLINSPNLQHLDVSFNYFSGSIPSFNTTPNLQYLDLSVNEWTGDIPSLPHLLHLEELYILYVADSLSGQGSSISRLFCDLRSLKRLSISGSGAAGPLDQQLWCTGRPSPNLTTLDLSSNYKLTGPFPAWIGLFFNLQHLDLSASNFSGSIPQEWQMLTQLYFLQLSNAASSPAMPVYLPQNTSDWLFRLPRLETLTLQSMGLTIRDFQCELGLSLLNQTLHTLDLSGNLLSGGSSLWHCLANHNFTFLSQLDLSNNPLAFDLASSQPLSSPQFQFLDLSSCELVGSLPMQVLLSSAVLQGINLGNNHLAGRIPWEIGSLGTDFSWLDLSFNNLTGPIPASMWNLSSANVILLSNNHLDGEIRLNGTNFNNLAVLYLENNHFTKAFFNNSHLGGLGILDLSSNKLEGDLQEFFGDYSVFNGLYVLLLSDNELTGSIPASLGRLAPNLLMVLDLSNNQLTGAIPESLKYLPALQCPVYNAWALVDFTLQSVKGVKFIGDNLLGHLDLSSNMLNGSIPPPIGELTCLNDLNLSRNLLSGLIPPGLSNLTQLQSLDLSYNNLDGSIPQAFSSLHSLEVFNVSFNPKLSGQIPGGPQLEVADSYKGDPNLCGYQIQKNCTYVNGSDQQQQEPATIEVDHQGGVQIVLDWIEEWTSIPGICLGYALGVGIMIWVLRLLNFYG